MKRQPRVRDCLFSPTSLAQEVFVQETGVCRVPGHGVVGRRARMTIS